MMKCSGCPKELKEGDYIFSREIGKVMPNSATMLPLSKEETGGGPYCEVCAGAMLNMTTQEIANAKTDLEVHIVRCGPH